MLGTIALSLILCYVVVVILAASTRASDPLVRRSVRCGAFAPVAMIVLVHLVGVATTLVLLLVFAGCSLLAMAAAMREREERVVPPTWLRPATSLGRHLLAVGHTAAARRPGIGLGVVRVQPTDILGGLVGVGVAVAIIALAF